MADLGFNNVGTAGQGLFAGIASKFTAPASGNITSIFVRIGQTFATDNVRCAVFADSAGVPGALLRSSNEIVVTHPTDADSWKETTITSLAVVSGTVYWLASWAQGGNADGRKDTGTTNQLSQQDTATYPTWTDPWTQVGAFDFQLSIYAPITETSTLMGQILT